MTTRHRWRFLRTTMVMRDFDHRQLDAYRTALEFVVHAEQLVRALPSERSALADQIRRASMSICLNTAEGAGEFSPAEKARFYRLARRSATECAAAIDICRVLDLSEEPALEAGDILLRRIVSILTRMIMRTAPGK